VDIDLQETQNIIDSAKEQVYLQGKTHTGNRAKPRRGQVFNCHLGVGVGSEFQKRRPCVVLSSTANNINNSVIVVAPITHTQKNYPVYVPIADKYDTSGTVVLSGYADLSNVRAISSYRLDGRICELTSEEIKLIDAAIARHMDIMKYYNTLVKAAEDREKYIERLLGTLDELRDITSVENDQELVVAVKRLAESSKDINSGKKTIDK
jgi:mRNA interferase MazF